MSEIEEMGKNDIDTGDIDFPFEVSSVVSHRRFCSDFILRHFHRMSIISVMRTRKGAIGRLISTSFSPVWDSPLD